MAELKIRTARHTMRVAAHPKRVYQLIAHAEKWPQIFEPTIAIQHLGFDGITERLHHWVMVEGDVQDWIVRRELNPHRLQVRFRREDSPEPLASLGGLWLVLPKGEGSLVMLDHHYRVVDDDPADAEWVAGSVDRNSITMLTALRDAAELGGAGLDELVLRFEDSVDIDGEARDVYDFLARAQDWPERLPHVTRMRMDEYVPDIQQMEMVSRVPDGTAESSSTVRICFPETHIIYKRITVSGLFRAHTGRWMLTELPWAVRATAQHTVLLREEAISEVLGPGSTLDDARASVRNTVGSFGLATLARAKAFAEARRPSLRRAA